ncbi:RHS repeat domain-containing protein [Pseudomonas defluvii]|uniref:RHS repeat domain-containing protein n=1 Tax=Pseudomonas defluvii TaxID=1876757 RepID=UPI003905F52D
MTHNLLHAGELGTSGSGSCSKSCYAATTSVPPQELTNQQGEIVWRAQHKAWGETQVQRSDWAQHKGIQNPLRFQGQYHDHETSLHYNRYRYYDPLVGRFISKDPIGYAGGLNLYVYAPNPVFWIDPFGLAAHRGRFQAQGEKLEESVAWNQDSPLTAIEARAKLEELKNKLDKGSLSVREEAFQKADNFVLSACKCGGVDAPVSKTFMVKGARRERVDIEVISGKAFGE